jgi:hypothetical protein
MTSMSGTPEPDYEVWKKPLSAFKMPEPISSAAHEQTTFSYCCINIQSVNVLWEQNFQYGLQTQLSKSWA